MDVATLCCRGYDCRATGVAGLRETYEGGRQSPEWVFDLNTREDRALALALALRLGAQSAMRANGSLGPAKAARAAWAFANEHLERTHAVIAQLDRLPPAEQDAALAAMVGFEGSTGAADRTPLGGCSTTMHAQGPHPIPPPGTPPTPAPDPTLPPPITEPPPPIPVPRPDPPPLPIDDPPARAVRLERCSAPDGPAALRLREGAFARPA
jgi:hypothetical protein